VDDEALRRVPEDALQGWKQAVDRLEEKEPEYRYAEVEQPRLKEDDGLNPEGTAGRDDEEALDRTQHAASQEGCCQ
jgi:hypothetical protein